MEVVHTGIDGLDVAFQGSIPTELRELLAKAQEAARAAQRPCVVEWRGERFEVHETGARGGYRWRLDTGPMGAVWFIKDGKDRDDVGAWNLRVSWRSAPLATLGLGRIMAETYRWLEAIGASVLGESIGRVDWCVDIWDDEFRLYPSHVITHSRTKHAAHLVDDGQGWLFPEATHAVSGRYTGVTCGKMPGRQVQIYDKTQDIKDKRKVEWWEIWRTNCDHLPEDCRVWRVEVRAGKDCLKDDFQIRTWKDLANRWGDVVRYALDTVRLCVPTDDGNRARWPLHRLWTVVQREAQRDLHELMTGLGPDKVKAARRTDLQRQFKALLLGLMASYAMVMQEAPEAVGDRAYEDFRDYVTHGRDDYMRRVEKARERYWFYLEDGHDDGGTDEGRERGENGAFHGTEGEDDGPAVWHGRSDRGAGGGHPALAG